MKIKLAFARKSKKQFLENRMKIAEGYIPIEFYKDKEYILESIKKNSSKVYPHIHEECFNDREILLETLKAMKKDGFVSTDRIDEEILKRFTSDREILKLLTQFDIKWYFEFESDREIALLACISNSNIWNEIRKEFMEDEDFILSVIEGNHDIFEKLNENLKMDKVFIRKALEKNGRVFNLLSEQFLQDKELINIVINQDPMTLQQQQIVNIDSDIAMLAAKKNGLVLAFLPIHYENYDEICREAIAQSPGALLYASENVKSDRKTVLEATKKDVLQFCYASEELRNDYSFVQQVINNGGLFHLDDVFNGVREAMIFTMKKQGYCTQVPTDAFQDIDKDFALQVVKISGILVGYLPHELMNDREVLMTAFEYATPDGREATSYGIGEVDKDLIFEVFVKYSVPTLIYNLDSMEDFELVRKIIQHNGYAYSLMKEIFKGDPVLIEEALKQCGYVEIPSEELYSKRMAFAYPEFSN